MKTVLQNERCIIELRKDDDKFYIHGEDITDANNLPTMYTRAKRGAEKAFEALKAAFDDNMTMYAAARFLDALKQKPHTYCAMD